MTIDDFDFHKRLKIHLVGLNTLDDDSLIREWIT